MAGMDPSNSLAITCTSVSVQNVNVESVGASQSSEQASSGWDRRKMGGHGRFLALGVA